MRDYVRCKVPLPGNPPPSFTPDYLFTTASTDWLAMNEYEIREDGTFALTFEYFTAENFGEERTADSPPSQVGPLPDFHRDLYFYNGSPVDLGNGERGYLEYCARFTDGKLSRITEVKRQTEAEWKAECAEARRKFAERTGIT